MVAGVVWALSNCGAGICDWLTGVAAAIAATKSATVADGMGSIPFALHSACASSRLMSFLEFRRCDTVVHPWEGGAAFDPAGAVTARPRSSGGGTAQSSGDFGEAATGEALTSLRELTGVAAAARLKEPTGLGATAGPEADPLD
mmetsp:Transcript_89436/g.164046  ORF Transcript_89436/g.164046 Transcript_89436/m.164046 type:complete len:144 (+) Transcript_89436:311-742(+)